VTSVLVVPNVGSWDPCLPKTEKILKYRPQGNTSTENNGSIKSGMVVKGRNKKPEKDDL